MASREHKWQSRNKRQVGGGVEVELRYYSTIIHYYPLFHYSIIPLGWWSFVNTNERNILYLRKKKAKLMTYLSPCDHDAAQKQEEKRSAYSWTRVLRPQMNATYRISEK